jgi:hypothetical protein
MRPPVIVRARVRARAELHLRGLSIEKMRPPVIVSCTRTERS